MATSEVEKESNEVSASLKVSAKTKTQSFIEKTLIPSLKVHDEVELSGLGNATPTVCNISELLKSSDAATVTKITTSVQGNKPKIQLSLKRGPGFDKVANK